MDPMAEIKASFFVECGELLEGLEEGLLQIQDGDEDPETVNAVFRAVHSIKGGAGAFGLEALVNFAHRFETVLDEARSDRLELTSEAVLLFLKAADVLADQVEAARNDTVLEGSTSEDTLAGLESLLGGPEAQVAKPSSDTDDDVDFSPQMLVLDLPGTETADENRVIRFSSQEGLAESGNEPLFLFRALAELAEVEAKVEFETLPKLKDLSPEKSYLAWQLSLSGFPTDDEIDEVFEFAQGLYHLSDVASEEEIESPVAQEPVAEFPPVPAAVEVPKPNETLTPIEQKEPEIQKSETAAKKPKALTTSPTVRVDLERIDRLVNLVGELVINQAMLSQSLTKTGQSAHADVSSGLEEFQQLTRDIQDSVMAIRAQPVKPLFQRMSRIVREAADDTNKKVKLVVEGESTEVDKTVIERLADPLTHMIRNAVDHGLEAPERRREAGKPEEGTIVLRASHRSGRVVIEIEDNGAGINRNKVHEIAVSKGLIKPDIQMSEGEIDNLLFMPGFSTASSISNLSGRGVGMDVVKRSIQALGGRIAIHSEPGTGSIFSISLPLTLAVLDGMVVEVEHQTMVVPLSSIVETLTLQDADIQELDRGTKVVHIRGNFVPLLDLGLEFGYRATSGFPNDSVVLFLLSEDGDRYALVVDRILEQRQVVIKGLADSYGYVPGVAAATILGDGKIALILDTVDLIARAAGRKTPQDNYSLAG